MTTPKPRIFVGHEELQLAADVWEPIGKTPSASTVILLHGGGQTRHSWKSAGSALAAAGFRVVSLDLRGHGDSDWSESRSYRHGHHAADLVRVIEQLGAARVCLVGASLGGIVSLLATASHPELVERLVLVDIVTRTEGEGVERILGFLTSHSGGFATLDAAAEAVAAYLPHRPKPRSPEGLRKNLRQHPDGRWYWHWDPAMFTDRPLDDAAFLDLLDRAARAIQQPTLLIQGLQSDLISDEGVEHFRTLLPHVEVVRLRDAAHTAATDDNDAFATAAIKFLAG